VSWCWLWLGVCVIVLPGKGDFRSGGVMCGVDVAQVVNKYRLALKAGEDATWFDRERLRTVLNEVLGVWNLA